MKSVSAGEQSGSHGIHFLFAAYGQFGGRKKIGVQHAIGRSYMAHHYHQFSLNGMQQFLPIVFGRKHGTYDSYYGIQFVQTAVCLDANIIFGNTRSAMNAGGSFISRTGIYFFHLSAYAYSNNLIISVSPQ